MIGKPKIIGAYKNAVWRRELDRNVCFTDIACNTPVLKWDSGIDLTVGDYLYVGRVASFTAAEGEKATRSAVPGWPNPLPISLIVAPSAGPETAGDTEVSFMR